MTFSVLSKTRTATTDFSDDTQLTTDIQDDGAPVNANSALDSDIRGAGESVSYALGFDNAVTNVDFRINDVDGDRIVRIGAFDVDGNQITVDQTGGRVDLRDTDGSAGADTADSQGGYAPDNYRDIFSVCLHSGPRGADVIEHSQNGGANSGINVTNVYFDAPVVGDDGFAGQ